MNTIEVNHLSVSFPSARGPVQVLRDVSLSFAQGKITAVVGESGSGKSILGARILRFLDSSARISGEILYREKSAVPERGGNAPHPGAGNRMDCPGSGDCHGSSHPGREAGD